MKSIDQAQKRATKILEEARKDYSALLQSIEGKQRELEAAEAALEDAVNTSDLEAYGKAAGDQTEARRALQMYEKRKHKLEAAPLMDKDEYDQLCAAIVKDVNGYFDDLAKEVMATAEALKAKADEGERILKDGNHALHVLQYDVLRGTDLEYNGNKPKQKSIKTVGNRYQHETANWASSMADSMLYRERVKKNAV